MSTGLDLWGSGAAMIATRKAIPPGSARLAQAQTKPPAMRKQPSAGLGPVTVHPTQSGVGPRITSTWYDNATRKLLVFTTMCRRYFDHDNGAAKTRPRV